MKKNKNRFLLCFKALLPITGLIVFLSSALPSKAQKKADVLAAASLAQYQPAAETQYQKVSKGKNAVQTCASALFVFYKNFVSSQDGNHCSFYPSCSQYAIQAIRKKGFFPGVLAAFDRLSRCNGMSPENYAVQKSTGLLYDPVP